MSDTYHKLRDEHASKMRELGKFLDPGNRRLDQEERQALNPILRGLIRDTQHYSAPKLIGQGGEKLIYKVRDLRTDRIVAMAKPLAQARDEEKEEFLREARLTACLQHPNIMSIYDQGVDEDGIPFFIMEFVRGDDLQQIIDKRAQGDPSYKTKYTRERLLEIFTKVCDAISYAHSRGVAHLDVKPANIKVGPFGEVHLCDWGLSRILTDGFDASPGEEDDFPNSDLLNDLAASGTAKGTPGFLSPEQADGVSKPTERSDVYALGAVLYYILTYNAPVQGETPQDTLSNTTAGKLVPFAKTVPKGLKTVALKALQTNPKNRYQSASELRDELDRYLRGHPTLAQKATPLARLGLLFKRRPTRFFIAGASLLLIALALAISSIQIDRSRREAIDARDLAEANLRLYLDESARSKNLDDNMRSAALELQSYENFLDATGKERLLRFQLAQGNPNPADRITMARRLAMLHFVRQNFSQSLPFFQQAQESPEDNLYYAFALQYKNQPSENQRWLSPAELRQVIQAIPGRQDNVTYALAYYYLRTAKAREQSAALLPLIELLLDRLNHRGFIEERLDSLQIQKTADGLSLSLEGNAYNVFNLPLPVNKTNSNVLSALQLHTLDLSRATIADMIQLQGSNLHALNIVGHPHVPEPQLRRLRNLKLAKLYHSLDRSDAELAKLLPQVQLIRPQN